MVVEARAYLQSLIFAVDLSLDDICVEGDALAIINKLKREEEDRSAVGDIIKESKSLLKRFSRYTICFVPRTVNKAAHAMAKWGRGCEQPGFWVEEALPEVETTIFT